MPGLRIHLSGAIGMGTNQGTADALRWIAELHPPHSSVHEAALKAADRIEAQLTPMLKRHISQLPLSKIFRLFKKPPPP